MIRENFVDIRFPMQCDLCLIYFNFITVYKWWSRAQLSKACLYEVLLKVMWPSPFNGRGDQWFKGQLQHFTDVFGKVLGAEKVCFIITLCYLQLIVRVIDNFWVNSNTFLDFLTTFELLSDRFFARYVGYQQFLGCFRHYLNLSVSSRFWAISYHI